MAASASKVVGSYEMVQRLGRGSFADVYLATHRENRQQFAIKVISKEKVIDPKNPKLQVNLETEISIMRDYNHENIVRLMDHFHSPRYIYLVLELCVGGDLSAFIKKRGRIDERVAIKFLFQLSSGLSFLYEKNIIHRDLKPANVLLSEDSENATLKLADFGFARQLAEASMAQTPCGTPLYMAPEIFEMHEYDSKADVWSTGCIFFEMIAGIPPFRGVNPKDLLNNIRTKPLVIPQDLSVSNESKLVLRKLLAIVPGKRASLDQLRAACSFLVDKLNLISFESQETLNGNSDSKMHSNLSTEEANRDRNSTARVKVPSTGLPSPPVSNVPTGFSLQRYGDRQAGTNPSSATTTFAMNLTNLNSQVSINPTIKYPYTPTSQTKMNSLPEESITVIQGDRRHSIDGPTMSESFAKAASTKNTSFVAGSFTSKPKGHESEMRARSVSADVIMGASKTSGNQGESWSSTDDDFVIVRSETSKTLEFSGSDVDNGMRNIHPFVLPIKNSVSSNQIDSASISKLVQTFEYISKLLSKACAVGDRVLLDSVFSSEQTLRREKKHTEDYIGIALSLYLHISNLIREMISYVNDTLNRMPQGQITLEKLRQGLFKLFDSTLSRSSTAFSNLRIQSRAANDSLKIPCAEVILYSIGLKMARESSVEMLLGNMERAFEQLEDAKVLLECVLVTCNDEEDHKTIFHYLQSINQDIYQIERAPKV